MSEEEYVKLETQIADLERQLHEQAAAATHAFYGYQAHVDELLAKVEWLSKKKDGCRLCPHCALTRHRKTEIVDPYPKGMD